MKTIWKYEIWKYEPDRLKEHQGIQMPRNSNILDVQLQDGVPVFWATVDQDLPMEERRFLLLRTGEEMPEYPIHYIGTLQIGTAVYHLFEELDEIPF